MNNDTSFYIIKQMLWLIDEEAAKTVRYIFKLCADGFGPTQIAKRLRNEKVLTPTAYKLQKKRRAFTARTV